MRDVLLWLDSGPAYRVYGCRLIDTHEGVIACKELEVGWRRKSCGFLATGGVLFRLQESKRNQGLVVWYIRYGTYQTPIFITQTAVVTWSHAIFACNYCNYLAPEIWCCSESGVARDLNFNSEFTPNNPILPRRPYQSTSYRDCRPFGLILETCVSSMPKHWNSLNSFAKMKHQSTPSCPIHGKMTR